MIKKLDEPVTSKDNSGDLTDFVPFIMDVVVSLPGNNIKVPVKILRDTAASQSFILEGVLSFSNESAAVGSDVPVLGFSMNDIGVPLHQVFVESDLVAVGIHPEFPVKGVAFLMGNVGQSPEGLAQRFPKVSVACAVTQSMCKMDEDEIDLSDSFLGDPDVGHLFSPDAAGYSDTSRPTNTSLSREQLIARQTSDVSLSPFFEAAVAGEEVESFSTGYFVKDGLIMRKWMPLRASADDDRSVVTQIVVLSPYRSEILNKTPLLSLYLEYNEIGSAPPSGA